MKTGTAQLARRQAVLPAFSTGRTRHSRPPPGADPGRHAGRTRDGRLRPPGLHGGGLRENTVEAFAEARRLGADGVELDVRRSADGALVVHHDATSRGRGAVAELGVGRAARHVPLLADALAACDGMWSTSRSRTTPAEPGWDPGESVAAADGGGDRRRRLDATGCSSRRSSRPRLRAVQAADERLALGVAVGLRRPTRGRGLERGGRRRVPGRPPLRRRR